MSRDKTRWHDNWEDEERQDQYHVPTMRPKRPPLSSQPMQRPRKRRKRSVWPWLLMGCAAGIVILVLAAAATIFIALRSAAGGSIIPAIANQATYTQQSQPQPIQISTITSMQVHNQIGNVTITVDPGAATPTLTSVKKVKAATASDANKEFGNITVQAQPAGTTLVISASVPDNGSIFGNHNDSVDLTLSLPPQSVNSAPTAPLTLNTDLSIGNIKVDGLSGVLLLKDSIGDISVAHAILANGSHLETGTGNVTFNGSLDTTPAANNAAPRYKLQSETGNLDVTLPAETNITLDANTNAGTITSDFPISTQTTANSANYYGPLNSTSPSAPPQPVLTLDASTGNITLHKT